MDSLNRRFLGTFEATHRLQPPAPRIRVSAVADVGLPTRTVHLLIDTGADRTLIAPTDARGVFGDEAYEEINRSADRIRIGGIGTGATVVERKLFCMFHPQSGPPVLLFQDFWIATELRDEQGKVINRHMPSLLGRDILNHFTLTLSPIRRLVEMVEEEPLPGSV